MAGCRDFCFMVVIFSFSAVIFNFLVVILCLPVVIFRCSPEVVVAGNDGRRWWEVATGGIRKMMVIKDINIKN